jgi:hypothetical protein
MTEQLQRTYLYICNCRITLKVHSKYDNCIKNAYSRLKPFFSNETPADITIEIKAAIQDNSLKHEKEALSEIENYFYRKCRKFPVFSDAEITTNSIKNFLKLSDPSLIYDTLPRYQHFDDIYTLDSSNESALIYNKKDCLGHLFCSEDIIISGDIVAPLLNAIILCLSINLLHKHYLFLHACGILNNHNCFIFLGLSGYGKSTIGSLAKGYKIISDDTLPVCVNGSIKAYASPFYQKKTVTFNAEASIPASCCFFINKSERTYAEPVTKGEALSGILKHHVHFMRLYSDKELEILFKIASDFTENLLFFNLNFEKNRSFLKTLKNLPLAGVV